MPRKPHREKPPRADADQPAATLSPDPLAHSAPNAAGPSPPRRHVFHAAHFTVVRLEDPDEVANLVADLVAVYQPANSQELLAVERIALAQQAMLRAARLEAGLFTSCLNATLDPTGQPFTPMSPEMVGDGDIEITRGQNRNYALAEGFDRMVKNAGTWSVVLRYQVQAERLYRRAVEDWERLRAHRENAPSEPTHPPELQPSHSAAAPESAHPAIEPESVVRPVAPSFHHLGSSHYGGRPAPGHPIFPRQSLGLRARAGPHRARYPARACLTCVPAHRIADLR